MKDVLLAPAPQSDRDSPVITNNNLNHSIVNSVTNDEDDWISSRKNSGHSIVNSITNDEDDWVDSRKNRDGTAVTIQHRPCNYRSVFSTSSTGMNQPQKHDITMREFNQAKPLDRTTSEPPSLSISEPTQSSSKFFEQESYLIRYEHMMKEQEMEQICTMSHVQSLLEILEDLLFEGQDKAYRNHTSRNDENILLKEFSLKELKEVQEKIEHSNEFDIIKTDKQFLMVLEIICEDKNYCTAVDSSEKKQEKISWAEIIQCYRICVVGMQTLEIIGSHGTIRKRAKERTLAVLSLYQKSSSANFSPSITVPHIACDAVPSRMRHDDSVIQSSGIDQGSQHNKRSRGLLRQIFLSFFTGAMVVTILFYRYSSPTEPMTQPRDIPFTNPTERVQCLSVENESISSTEREFEVQVFENTIDIPSPDKSVPLTINATQDELPMEPYVNEDSTFKKKTSTMNTLSSTTATVMPPIARARTANSIALLPSELSHKARAFDKKTKNKLAKKDKGNNGIKKLQSSDLEVANVIGGAATAIYFLSLSSSAITAVLGWVPMGLTVMIATVVGHSVRDGIAVVWRKLKKRNNVSS